MIKFWIFFLKNKSFTYLIMITLVVAGLMSVIAIPKESSPEVIIPVGIVTTVLRGGSGEDVEKLVTNKLEQEIANVENIDKITSTSRDGVSVISAQFLASANVEKSIQDLKDAVDRVKGQLPADADEPNVLKVNFADQPILIISVSADLSPIQLTDLGEDLKDELKKVKGVSKVEVSGVREKQVQVILKTDELVKYGLSADRVLAAIQSSNASLPIGKIEVDNIEYPVKFSGSIEAGSEVADISFTSDSGTVVYLRDIATISDGLENPKNYSRTSVNGEPSENALTLFVYKKSGGDVTQIGQAVKDKLEDLKKSKLTGANVVVSIDAGKQVNKDLTDLSRTAMETVILVMLVLFLTLGWRESVVAGISIPLSFVIAFSGLYFSGNTINFLSLFSLILAIGILVDSGIVVAESIHTRMKNTDVENAAIGTLKEYAWPLIAGTMTTVAVFAPLFFLSGIVGQFVKSIPFTIIFVLIASIAVALGMVPILATLILKKENESEPNKFTQMQEKYFHIVQDWYKNFLGNILLSKRKQRQFYFTLVGLFVASFALVFSGMIKVELFPQDNQDFVVVSIEKEEGTSLTQTDLATRQVEEILYSQKFVESFVVTVGAASSLLDNSGGTDNSKFANITVMLNPDRGELTSTDAVAILRKEFAIVRDAKVKVGQASNGPPSGKPVVIKFLGDDLDELALLADKAETILQNIKGVQDVETSLRDDGTQFELIIDRAKASQVGLSPIQVAGALRTAVSGNVATTIKKQDNDIDVLLRVGLNDKFINPEDAIKTNIDSIKNLEIKTQKGSVLLGTILDIKLVSSRSIISHDGQKRIVSVSSNLKEGTTATEVVNAFKTREKELNISEKVQINYGGETEDVDNTFRDMLIALVAGMILMLAILVLEFNSFRYSLYLLSAVPLSLIGVFFGLFFTGRALSFSAMLGIIALAGVIINHAIILLDSIIHRLDNEQNLTSNNLSQNNLNDKKENILFDSIIESSAIRLRPIILTTLTTVVGMIPLAGVSALWGPLAITIMFGLLFSMVLTLIFIPLRFYKKPGKRYLHLKR